MRLDVFEFCLMYNTDGGGVNGVNTHVYNNQLFIKFGMQFTKRFEFCYVYYFRSNSTFCAQKNQGICRVDYNYIPV